MSYFQLYCDNCYCGSLDHDDSCNCYSYLDLGGCCYNVRVLRDDPDDGGLCILCPSKSLAYSYSQHRVGCFDDKNLLPLN